MDTSIAEYVRNHFDGVLVVADIHGDFELFSQAAAYAKSEHLFLASLGDLVDRGNKPFEVVSAMASIVYEGDGCFIIGNHDNKHYRHALGAKVIFSNDGMQTLKSVGPDREAEFFKTYISLVETPLFSAYFHRFDDIMLVHAAQHDDMWDESLAVRKSARNKYMVGETDGDVYPDGKPIRLYNWIDDIPAGKTVIVGHDRAPITNTNITAPLIVPNKSGGNAVFLDTGCGKGGFLSCAVIMPVNKKFSVVSYKEFK